MWLVGTGETAGNLPFRLEGGEYVLGRTKQCQILILDVTVSRRHARLVSEAGILTVEDLDSSNGTRVNECPVTECELRPGDYVRFGGVSCAISASPLVFRGADDEEEGTYRVPRDTGSTVRVDGLTGAQKEVLDYVLQGRTEAEIATALGNSPHTIHTHLKAIFQRLGVHSRAELLLKVLRKR